MKVLSAVRHSGKSYWAEKLGFADCDEIISKAIGWPKHFDKKHNTKNAREFECNQKDEHEIAKDFSKVSWKLLKTWGDETGGVVAIPEVWSARSFWEWNVKPDVLVTIDEERHKQNLLELNQGHMWGTIKFWRHMLEHEAKENNIFVVQTFEDAVLYLNENKSKKY